MSFPRYPKYRSADLPWVSEVPSHWATTQLRFLLKDGKEGIRIGPFGSSIKIDDLVQYGPKVYGQENVIYRDFTLGDRRIAESHFNDLAEYEIRSGDVLVTMAGTAGRCQVVPNQLDRGIMDSHLVRMRFRSDLVYEPLVPYLIESAAYVVAQIHVAGRGTTMQGLNSTIVKHLQLGLPSRSEQVTIASFLDRETAKIDALIAEQQRLIELLQEKRQAVISHAVTKGLNPDAPMKDSGIEWLGEVPEHWETTRLDRVSDFVNGKAHEPFVHDDGRFICVTSRFISTDGEAIRMCSENLTPAILDDVLMVMSDLPNGRALARTFHVQDDRAYAINQRVCAIRPAGASPRYLSFLLNRNPWFLQNDDGLNQTHLSISDFRKMPLVLPPVDEQDAIARSLDHVVALFAGLVSHAETCISVLQERRSALISAAVTGQIDVRGLAESEAA